MGGHSQGSCGRSFFRELLRWTFPRPVADDAALVGSLPPGKGARLPLFPP
jgi:hypothetical protein